MERIYKPTLPHSHNVISSSTSTKVTVHISQTSALTTIKITLSVTKEEQDEIQHETGAEKSKYIQKYFKC